MHGKGYDRWFDKSFTLCVGTNGRVSLSKKQNYIFNTLFTLGFCCFRLDSMRNIRGKFTKMAIDCFLIEKE